MEIKRSAVSDAPAIASVLEEAEQWLVQNHCSLWTAKEISLERITQDTTAGTYYSAHEGQQIVGVMRLEMEDAYFWPEMASGTSIYLHKFAVRRAQAGGGVSTALLSHAKNLARVLGRSHVRLDCFADRERLRIFYEKNGFSLHDIVRKCSITFARYETLTGRELI